VSDPSSELSALIGETSPSPSKIGAFLDRLPEPERIEAVRSLSGKQQKKLYHAVDGYRPLALTDMVGPEVPAMHAVRHFGKNSMPMFTLFEKRFYRGPDADPSAPSELCGANFQSISPLTGPGYYVAVLDPQRHEVLVDYRRVPSVAPEGWPRIVRNESDLRTRLVYGFMVDTLRRVSEHVTIGSAARHGKPFGAYFVLCRQERP
jgi:hypothetical protein